MSLRSGSLHLGECTNEIPTSPKRSTVLILVSSLFGCAASQVCTVKRSTGWFSKKEIMDEVIRPNRTGIPMPRVANPGAANGFTTDHEDYW